MNSHKFRASPSHYRTGYFQSVFVAAPIDYATISPTVRLYGVEFGTDKLDHFFQQGYQYYKMVNQEIAKGASADTATSKAVKWGQKTERTYFGLLVSGVYSNADLYANYAGMKFYQCLSSACEINKKRRTAPVFLQNGAWTVDTAALRDNLIKPYLTVHMNEALNPSVFAFTIFGSVRRAVKKNGCPEWRSMFPERTKADLESRSASLEKWNGEDYGFTRRERSVSVAVCFDDQLPSNSLTNASAS